MKQSPKDEQDDLRMDADAFDYLMRKALGVQPVQPAAKPKGKPETKPRKPRTPKTAK